MEGTRTSSKSSNLIPQNIVQCPHITTRSKSSLYLHLGPLWYHHRVSCIKNKKIGLHDPPKIYLWRCNKKIVSRIISPTLKQKSQWKFWMRQSLPAARTYLLLAPLLGSNWLSLGRYPRIWQSNMSSFFRPGYCANSKRGGAFWHVYMWRTGKPCSSPATPFTRKG
jgi:hypothetical protein